MGPGIANSGLRANLVQPAIFVAGRSRSLVYHPDMPANHASRPQET